MREDQGKGPLMRSPWREVRRVTANRPGVESGVEIKGVSGEEWMSR